MCWISIRDVGPQIAVLADEDVEEDPDRWCSSTECGQELWQIACHWVWNRRLCLGQTLQGVQVREIEWAPPKETPPVFVAEDPPAEEYGPWQWAAAVGRATGRFGAEDARVARGWEAALSSRGQPVVERSASRECLYESRLSTWPTRPIVCHVLCQSSVSRRGPKEIGHGESAPSAVFCPRLPLLSTSLSCSVHCAGWMWQADPCVAPG